MCGSSILPLSWRLLAPVPWALWNEYQEKSGISAALLKTMPVCHYFAAVSASLEHHWGDSIADALALSLGEGLFFIQRLPLINFLSATCCFCLSFLFICFKLSLLA